MRMRASSGKVPGLYLALMLVCLSILALLSAPRYAWAEEGDDIPVGVLTLCDNPFAIDCGHDHESSSIVPTVEEQFAQEYANSSISQGADDGPPLDCHDRYCSESGDRELSVSQAMTTLSAAIPGEASATWIAVEFSDAEENGKEASFAVQVMQRASSNSASNSASNQCVGDQVSSELDVEARMAVEDEGLYRHEFAAVLAEVKAGISRAEFDEIVVSAGGLSAEGVTDDDLAYGLVKLRILDSSSVLQTINRLKTIPGFLRVQPNYVYRVCETEDSYTEVDDHYASRQWELSSVNAFAAWDLAKTMGSVAVAVIDTGVDLNHPDLASNIVATHNSLSSVNTVKDQIGHGTHVAGIIAGVANNGMGIAGVSYNASLVIIKASSFSSNEFDSASLVRAYEWLESLDSSGKTVAEHYNVRVVNMSIGGLDETRASNLPDDAIIQAILKARDEYGLLTVVSAGNGKPEHLPYFAYPGDSNACLSVMNLYELVNEDYEVVGVDLHESSNFNVVGTEYKDVCAPGTDIYSTWINGKYAIDSGTSMAAPVVSGVAALLFAVNPYLTPQMVMSILESTAIDLGDEGWDERYGYGEINAVAALRIASRSRIDGYDVVGIGGKVPFSASLGLDLEEDPSYARSWTVMPVTGWASVDENGVLTGQRPGEVTLISTCRATSGAEISAIKTIYVLKESISGDNYVVVGSASTPYQTTETSRTWVWQVENGTGRAHIDQDAILIADEPGTVYVTATCASNTDIVIRKEVAIIA